MNINVTLPLIVALPLFFLAYRYYARYIARVFGEDDKNPTPAVAINDQKDYVPTKNLVLFGHHFAAIAGAGPIIGPTVGLIFGFIPCLLWLILGAIFGGMLINLMTPTQYYKIIDTQLESDLKSYIELQDAKIELWNNVIDTVDGL